MAQKYLAVGDVVAEDRRRLFAFARDLLNSDYAGHRLTFQLFAQSPAFAHLLAVYNNYDFAGPADLVRHYAGLDQSVTGCGPLVSDLNVIGAECVACVRDRGGPRRGAEQGELDLVFDAAVAIRDGLIVAVGPSPEVLRSHGDDGVPVVDASGMSVVPGLIECHSHPLFAGERHAEYAERLAGASLAEIAARGGGIWASVLATRAASDDELLEALRAAYPRILAGGVTTLEVKSGYGLTLSEELRQLELLERSRALTPLELVITFLGAHVVPVGLDADAYTQEVLEMLAARPRAGACARFTTSPASAACSRPTQALSLLQRSRELGVTTNATRTRGPARRAGRPPSPAERSRPST